MVAVAHGELVGWGGRSSYEGGEGVNRQMEGSLAAVHLMHLYVAFS